MLGTGDVQIRILQTVITYIIYDIIKYFPLKHIRIYVGVHKYFRNESFISLQVHRLILATRSPIFEELLVSDPRWVKKQNVGTKYYQVNQVVTIAINDKPEEDKPM